MSKDFREWDCNLICKIFIPHNRVPGFPSLVPDWNFLVIQSIEDERTYSLPGRFQVGGERMPQHAVSQRTRQKPVNWLLWKTSVVGHFQLLDNEDFNAQVFRFLLLIWETPLEFLLSGFSLNWGHLWTFEGWARRQSQSKSSLVNCCPETIMRPSSSTAHEHL